MASLDSLHALLEEELKDIYDAEKQLTKALPKMAKKASSPDLKEGLEAHLRQTEEQIERLEQVFEQLEMPAKGKPCKGMKNLIAEGNEMIGEAEDDDTRDAVMIAAAQKVEHYEIAAYGTLRTWAQLLNMNEVASLLEESLEEEKETDQKLTELAESHINLEAAEEGEGEERMSGRGRASGSSRKSSTARGARQQAAERGGRKRTGSRRSR
jgi:ferritin-like metal-binding protein YciE